MDLGTTVRVGVLTVSDSCSRGEASDTAGPAIVDMLEGRGNKKKMFPDGWKVTQRKCVSDESASISDALLRWCDDDRVQLAVTTGGTGMAPRDVTPEATESVLERRAPGLVHQMLSGSLSVTPLASLSRLTAGIRGNTVIVNLPGSRKAATECLGFIAPALPHAIDLVTDKKAMVSATHAGMSDARHHGCPHHDHKEPAGGGRVGGGATLAGRPRQSPYPMISVSEAQATVLGRCAIIGQEEVYYEEALGRVLNEDVMAREPLPPFPASVKDGYAVLSSDGCGVREVSADAEADAEGDAGTAGSDPAAIPALTPGRCLRVNTGGPVPPGSDVAVVQVEDTRLAEATADGGREIKVEMLSCPPPGTDIRPVGSDIRAGSVVLGRGAILGPAELGLLATVGATRVGVQKLPTVGLLSTGNELQSPSEEVLRPGAIRDSNKTTLKALLREEGFPFLDFGISRDEASSLSAALASALDGCDLLVTTGGVSMGDRDILRQVLKDVFSAEIHFARVEMKPGKPTTFATLSWKGAEKLVLGLPGNPVSAAVTAGLYVLPACRKMAGRSKVFPAVVRARLPSLVRLDRRPEFARCVLSWRRGDPVAEVSMTGSQMSSRLLSCAGANALLMLPPRSAERHELPPGHEVDAMIIAPLRRGQKEDGEMRV